MSNPIIIIIITVSGMLRAGFMLVIGVVIGVGS